MVVSLLQDNPQDTHALAWVGVDWGTSSLRLWCMDKDNNAVKAIATEQGMSSLSTPQQFEYVLLEHLHACASNHLSIKEPLTVLCCGMVGAKQGWLDAGYQTLPWPITKPTMPLLVKDTDKRIKVYIAQGLAQQNPADVMRGEETQLLGLIKNLAQSHGVVCLPGTHSKWATFNQGKVTAFNTCITGELFALLSTHSLLKHSVQKITQADYATGTFKARFMAGVAEAINKPTQVTQRLFSIRAEDVLQKPNATNASAYLSGLLIGQELAAMQDLWRTQAQLKQPIHLIGAGNLIQLYQQALAVQGVNCLCHDASAMVLAGLGHLYRQIVFETSA